MRFSAIFLLTVILFAPSRAQFEVSITPAKSGYLLFEPVSLNCRVRNTSGALVVLGESVTNATARLVVTGPDGRPPRYLGGKVLPQSIPVEPLQQASFPVDLTTVYEILAAGHYSIQLEIHHARFVYTSARVAVEVLTGTEVGQVVGTAPPRLFLLKTATRSEGVFFYVRIDNPEQTICHGVYEIDRYLSGPTLEKLFDKKGALHILHPSAPNQFTHSVYPADGKPVSRDRWMRGFAEIGLGLAPDGSVRVINGTPAPGS